MADFGNQKFQRRMLQLLLILGDFLAISAGFMLARYVRFGDLYYGFVTSQTFIFVLSVLIVCNYIFELYEPNHWRSKLFSLPKIFFSLVSTLALVSIGVYIVGLVYSGLVGRGVLAGTIVVYGLLSCLMRYFIEKLHKENSSRNQWLCICTTDGKNLMEKEVAKSGFSGQFFFISSNEDVNKVLKILKSKEWTGIIAQGEMDGEVSSSLMEARLSGYRIYSYQQFFEIYWSKVPILSLNSSWVAFCDGFLILQSQTNAKIKRLFDIIVSAVILVTSAPIMLITYIVVKLTSKGPAIFSQSRVGERGIVFTIFKFRSMELDAEKSGAQWAQQNDPRVTRFGKIIRKTRIDELPQLINVLKGEMSFIGPRPERPEFTTELKKKIPFYDLRHIVKPGLSGWAQVMYPYGASEEDAVEKLQYELFYIKNYSLLLDLDILLKTISTVILGKGR